MLLLQRGDNVDMDIEVDRTSPDVVVTVRGELDSSNAHDVYTAALAESEQAAGDVVVDLAGISFIDSVGLGMLVRTRDDLVSERRSRLVLRDPSENVRRILTLTALLDQFEIV